MSRPRIAAWVLAIAVLAAIAIAAGMRWPRAPRDAPSAQRPAAAQQPPGVVTVSPQAQQQSGLETATASAATLHPTADAYAVALDVRPLLATRQQVVTAQAQLRAAQSTEHAARAEYERANKLFNDDRNVSEKAMQAAEAAWRAEQGRLDAAAAALREGEAAAAQQFGPALAGDAAAPSTDVREITARKAGLVQVMLPSSSDAAPALVSLSAPGYPSSTARRIGPAAQVDGALAGRAFLYRSDVVYPAGLRLRAQVPLPASASAGFVVPESAVVWYGGQPWVFVQAGADRFVRRALKDPQAAAGGLFTTTSFASGELIVTRGAQLLQSEALKPKGAAASACSDPECDD